MVGDTLYTMGLTLQTHSFPLARAIVAPDHPQDDNLPGKNTDTSGHNSSTAFSALEHAVNKRAS